MWYVGFGGKISRQGHAFSKSYQYVTIKEFFCKYLWYVSIKVVKGNLQNMGNVAETI
jgi:hypothetical protein